MKKTKLHLVFVRVEIILVHQKEQIYDATNILYNFVLRNIFYITIH
jgi:hypothetical protein